MADELADSLKYQVLLLGPDKGARRLRQFKQEFEPRVRDLGLDASNHTDVKIGRSANDRNHTGVQVVVWCGGHEETENQEIQWLERLLQNGVIVFPVVDSLVDYPDIVPEVLQPLNGMEWGNCHQLVTSILETFGLIRAGKRVFISYRRKESQGVANQLFDELQRRGYTTFLDIASIEPGRAVQAELKSQLSDMDVVVLLHTKRALGSSWVMQEVLDAQRRGTEVFDLLWPNAKTMRELSLTITRKLEENDFEKSDESDPAKQILNADFMKEFVVQIERARIRSVKTRRDRLLKQMAEDADSSGQRFAYYSTGHEELPTPFVGFGPRNSTDILRVAFVGHGTPSAIELQQGEMATQNINEDLDNVPCVVFDELGLLEQQVNHLDWLDRRIGQSRIRLVPLSEHLDWLTEVNP